VVKNIRLSTIFGAKKDEVMGGWGKFKIGHFIFVLFS
jgi:hypothetical protein